MGYSLNDINAMLEKHVTDDFLDCFIRIAVDRFGSEDFKDPDYNRFDDSGTGWWRDCFIGACDASGDNGKELKRFRPELEWDEVDAFDAMLSDMLKERFQDGEAY